jgi:hypothetical protein
VEVAQSRNGQPGADKTKAGSGSDNKRRTEGDVDSGENKSPAKASVNNSAARKRSHRKLTGDNSVKKKNPPSRARAERDGGPLEKGTKTGTKKPVPGKGAKKNTGRKPGAAASKKSSSRKSSSGPNKLGVENSLVNNINARKKQGISRPKKKSTVTKAAYKKMENNWK